MDTQAHYYIDYYIDESPTAGNKKDPSDDRLYRDYMSTYDASLEYVDDDALQRIRR